MHRTTVAKYLHLPQVPRLVQRKAVTRNIDPFVDIKPGIAICFTHATKWQIGESYAPQSVPTSAEAGTLC